MADYGHDLVFGTFLTPRNAEPQAPVAAWSAVNAKSSYSATAAAKASRLAAGWLAGITPAVTTSGAA